MPRPVLIEDAPLPGLRLVTPRRHGDGRGWFMETFREDLLRASGVDVPWVQDNHSYSAARGTLRGLHYQAPPRAQWKLVRCGRGRVLDAVVDARVGSPTYGASFTVELSADDGRQLLIPAGFLHGFVTLTDDVELLYKCSDGYSAPHDGAVRWDSAGVDWGVADPVLSDRDRAAPPLASWASPFRWEP